MVWLEFGTFFRREKFVQLSFPLKSTSFPGFSFSGPYGAREGRVGEKPGNEVGLKCISLIREALANKVIEIDHV